MIVAALVALKKDNGSSRQAIKIYIKATYEVPENFEKTIDETIDTGVCDRVFCQPKGLSGPVKLYKK